MPTNATLECDQSGAYGSAVQYDFAFFRKSRMLCLIRGAGDGVSAYELEWTGQLVSCYSNVTYSDEWFGELPEFPPSAYRPDVVMTGNKSAQVFVVAGDRKMYTASWKSGESFGEWQPIGDGTFTSGPSCAKAKGSNLDYTMICAGRGDDGAVWVSRQLK